MGSTAQVVVWADAHADRLADLAMARISLLEHCWTRFQPASELNRLNARAGSGPMPASGDLLRLVQTMVDASEWTDGAVDASVLDAVCAAGYEADFEEIRRRSAVSHDGRQASATVLTTRPAGGMGGVDVDHAAGTIRLPPGRRLDPGAVGKGLAAEIVAEEIQSAGAAAVLVCLGGDVVVRGAPPAAPAWRVSVQDDRREVPTSLTVIDLDAERCAVATSSVLKRRWAHGHHLIDPGTGLPARSDVAQATIVAPLGWQAEAAATLAVLRGSRVALPWLATRSLSGFLFPHDPVEPPRTVGRPAGA